MVQETAKNVTEKVMRLRLSEGGKLVQGAEGMVNVQPVKAQGKRRNKVSFW